MDSRKIKTSLLDYLEGQNRFQQLGRSLPALAEELHGRFGTGIKYKHNKYQKLAMDEFEMLEYLKKQLGEEVSLLF